MSKEPLGRTAFKLQDIENAATLLERVQHFLTTHIATKNLEIHFQWRGKSRQRATVLTIGHGHPAVPIAGITVFTIKLQTLITRLLSQVSRRNLIAGNAVVTSLARKPNNIDAGQDRLGPFMRLLVLRIGKVGNHCYLVEILLHRAPAGRQSNVTQATTLRWVEMLFHVAVTHCHPQEAFRRAEGQRLFCKSSRAGRKKTGEEWER